MPSSRASSQGTAELQGKLWGARAENWAAQEERHAPLYEEVIGRIGLGPGTRVLDVGCASGVFCRVAADRGAAVFGLDASEALIAIARRRVPEADLRVGDLQFLPFEADMFDVVTGFNSFQFAADITAALREAARVARKDARAVIQVWGRTERCDLTAAVAALAPLRPPPPSDAGTPVLQPLWEPEVLEAIATEAGLVPAATGDVVTAFEYPDEETLVRSVLASALGVQAARTSGEESARMALVQSLEPFRTAAGGYRLENEWHYLIASV